MNPAVRTKDQQSKIAEFFDHLEARAGPLGNQARRGNIPQVNSGLEISFRPSRRDLTDIRGRRSQLAGLLGLEGDFEVDPDRQRLIIVAF